MISGVVCQELTLMETITKEKAIEHPLENVFDIESGTTLVEYQEPQLPAPIELPNYDEKDQDIETRLDNIYTLALNNANTLADEIELVEGKYKARVAETSAAMLNVALGACREKSLLKQHKDKLILARNKSNHPDTINNNLVVASQSEILKLLQDSQKL